VLEKPRLASACREADADRGGVVGDDLSKSGPQNGSDATTSVISIVIEDCWEWAFALVSDTLDQSGSIRELFL